MTTYVCVGLGGNPVRNAAIVAGMQAIAADFDLQAQVCATTYICIGLSGPNDAVIEARVDALAEALDSEVSERETCPL